MCVLDAHSSCSGVLEGIFTGLRMLACVISLRANRKARTKPLCLWGGSSPSRHFQCLALNIKLHELGLFEAVE